MPGMSIPGRESTFLLMWGAATGRIIAGTTTPPKSISTIIRKNDFSEIRQDNFGKGRKGYDTKVTPRGKTSQPQRIDCIPEIYIPKYLGTRSDFVYFLRGLFNEPETGPIIQRLTGEYCLGCTDTGAVIYWQIDGQKRVRTGKVMRYNPQTGKRLKNGCNAGRLDARQTKA